ncbi:ATP-binding protein [Gordonia zhaorongruii]|uniref:ATP-binding protein n=1 Tax=Gordonia zhaorongruii TaxID=2597659 RepID=UPI001180EB99|nr:ATP-binding protein [Gordonia zhaorongruii]
MNEYRVQRASALTVAVSTIVVPFLSVYPAFLAGDGLTERWWTPLSFTLVVGAAIPLLIAALPVHASPQRLTALRRAALILALANLVVLILWFVAWTHVPAIGGGSPPIWPANTVVLPAIVFGTLYPTRYAMTYVIGSFLLLATAQQMAGFEEFGYQAYLNQLMSTALLGVYLAMMHSMMTMARSVDAHRRVVLDDTVGSAAAAARATERYRLDIVMRDKVGAVLRGITRGEPDASQGIQARRVLDELDGTLAAPVLTEQRAASETVSAAEAVVRLRESAIAFGDELLVAIDASEGAPGVSEEVVEALSDALSEAVGNSVNHAGAAASTAIVGLVGSEAVRVRVVDDGCGFDVDRIAADRFGVTAGVCGRMAHLPGGSATIDTEPGEGTMVSLEWVRP